MIKHLITLDHYTTIRLVLTVIFCFVKYLRFLNKIHRLSYTYHIIYDLNLYLFCIQIYEYPRIPLGRPHKDRIVSWISGARLRFITVSNSGHVAEYLEILSN